MFCQRRGICVDPPYVWISNVLTSKPQNLKNITDYTKTCTFKILKCVLTLRLLISYIYIYIYDISSLRVKEEFNALGISTLRVSSYKYSRR